MSASARYEEERLSDGKLSLPELVGVNLGATPEDMDNIADIATAMVEVLRMAAFARQDIDLPGFGVIEFSLRPPRKVKSNLPHHQGEHCTGTRLGARLRLYPSFQKKANAIVNGQPYEKEDFHSMLARRVREGGLA